MDPVYRPHRAGHRSRQAVLAAVCLALALPAARAQMVVAGGETGVQEMIRTSGSLPPGYAVDWQGRMFYVGGSQPAAAQPLPPQAPIYSAGYAQAPAPGAQVQGYSQPSAVMGWPGQAQAADAGCNDTTGSLLGTVLGAMVGGMAGRSIGKGSGRGAATGVGVIAGAAVGSQVGNRCR